jgi:hypothetical protein
MDNFDRLVQFIDRHTHHGTQELPQIFGEGVGAEAPGVEDLDQFIDRDWLRLQGYWGERSDNWILDPSDDYSHLKSLQDNYLKYYG